MIFNLLIYLILVVVSSIFNLLPVVTLSSIPLIGTAMRGFLVSAIQMYNGFITTFPYAQTAFQIMLYVIIPFELLMLLGKFLLGHRLPANHN